MFALKASTFREHFSRLMEGLAARIGLSTFADDAAFLADKGTPAEDADRYFNSTLRRIRIFNSGTRYSIGG